MIEKQLNIISFNIPYPADYGGVIDVFYKLKALSENNVKIILHAFEYGREHASELEKYCKKIHYYKRKTGILSQLSFLPYIVNSRRNKELLSNLQKNNYPVLFEGLHSCYYLNHPSLKNRLKLVRAHNIEHKYYSGLAANTTSFFSKLYFYLEALRLKIYEKQLHHAQFIFALSSVENAYFEKQYGKTKTIYVPLFFQSNKKIVLSQTVKPYVLYHGDLSTPENVNAAKFLIRQIASKDNRISWIFAGKNPDASLLKCAEKQENVSVRANLAEEELLLLIREAAVNILYTNQTSGVKIKLLNALYNGHYCLANKEMLAGSGLEELCRIIPNDPDEILDIIKKCLRENFSDTEIIKREKRLNQLYNNTQNAHNIINITH